MADITLCTNKECPLSDECWRFNCPPNPLYQSYADFKPEKDDESGEMKCSYFIEFPSEMKTRKQALIDLMTQDQALGLYDTEPKVTKEKTAMQQFMEFLEKDDRFNPKSLIAQQFLGIERQQIEAAVDYCDKMVCDLGYVPTGEQYFTEKYCE